LTCALLPLPLLSLNPHPKLNQPTNPSTPPNPTQPTHPTHTPKYPSPTKPTRIADGPLRLELSRSLETDLPSVAFGVAAAVLSNEDDSRVEGAGVRVTIAPANTRCGGCLGLGWLGGGDLGGGVMWAYSFTHPGGLPI